MAIHPYTQHDIATLRVEERLLRAQDAYRAEQVREVRREQQGTAQPAGLLSRVLQRLGGRKGANALPHLDADAA